MAEHLKKTLSARHSYVISTWLQGSYKYATLIKPVHALEEYDVDLGVFFHWKNADDVEPTPKQLRDWVQAELLEYGRANAEVKRVERPLPRCSRTSYARQFHIDTPVYHLDPETDKRRLACIPGTWEHSDPKAIYKWFKTVVCDDDRPQLRRLVRYLKAWAALSFDDAVDSRPSSILLTVLAAEAFRDLWAARLAGLDDDDALAALITAINSRLTVGRCVENPVDETENLNRIPDDAWPAFEARLTALQDIAERAIASEDEAGAALAWSEALSFLMPLPEATGVEMVDPAGRSVMVLPEIDIVVTDQQTGRFITTHHNEVPGVAKGCKLTFSIVNPQILPAYCSIEWTVRNEGTEADERSDLGHRSEGMLLLTAEERTVYAGRHFMDCIVRTNGQIYALRRVSVTIRDVTRVLRNPPRPAYAKLRSVLHRRR